MNTIDTLQLSFQSPVVQSTKSLKQKMDTSLAKETTPFNKLFAAMSTEGKVASENQQQDILEKIEEVLKGLQELPQDTLSTEEQDRMYAIVQMLSFQTMHIKEQLQGTGSSQEKLIMSSPTQEKLMTLLHQINTEFQKLSAVATKPFGETLEFVGVDGRNVLADPEKFEQVFKQLVASIQQLEKGQQAKGKPTSFQQIELLEQMEKLLKQVTSLTQQQESRVPATQLQSSNGEVVETSRQVPVKVVVQQQVSVESQIEPAQTEDNSQALTGSLLGGAKASQASGRTEPTTQTPTVRMSHIIDELGEVLKGSIRLNSTQEGSRIRVNIFPEHLGHLEILLTASNGKITAQIMASSLVAKEALDLQVNQLRNTLLLQGVTIEKIEITHNNSQPSNGQQSAHSEQRFAQQQRQGNASHSKNGYQRSEEEVTAERNQSVDGGLIKVDYTI